MSSSPSSIAPVGPSSRPRTGIDGEAPSESTTKPSNVPSIFSSPSLSSQAFSFLTFIVRIAPESRKPSPNPTGEPCGESSVPTHSPDETKAIASPNEQGRTDPSGRNKVCSSQYHSTATTMSPPQSHSRPVEMDRTQSSRSRHHAQIRSRVSLDQSNSSTLGFQQGSTLNGPDSPPKPSNTFLGNSQNPKTDISTGTDGETTTTQSHLSLTDCPLPLGKPTGKHAGIGAQSTPLERDSGVSMSGGRSQTGQPTSATPSGAPLDLKPDVPPPGNSLRQLPPQPDHTPRGAPSTNDDPRARSNDNLSASRHSNALGHSLHAAQHPYPPPRSLDRSRPLVSTQPPSLRPMTVPSQNRPGSSHPGPTATKQPTTTKQSSGIFCCNVNRQ